jgi:cytochrome c oxidase subunit IV
MTEHTLDHGHAGGHASPRTYWIILVVLAVITLLEVGTYFVPWLHERLTLLFAILSVMAIVKFALVVGWYMHLRYDALYYRRVFIVPLILATAMIVVVTVLTGLRFLL